MNAPFTVHMSVWWIPIILTIVIVAAAVRIGSKQDSGSTGLLSGMDGALCLLAGICASGLVWGIFFAVMYFCK